MKSATDPLPETKAGTVCMTVNPGVCGFGCTITARGQDRRSVALAIGDSQCNQIRRLGERLSVLSMRELFMPLTRNPVYLAAEKAGCHASCVIPAALLKTAEVALGMALPRPVHFEFAPCEES